MLTLRIVLPQEFGPKSVEPYVRAVRKCRLGAVYIWSVVYIARKAVQVFRIPVLAWRLPRVHALLGRKILIFTFGGHVMSPHSCI